MDLSEKTTSNRASAVAGAMLGISMLLLVHRYWGIDHDAALYLGEALHLLQPDIYGKDLYFASGSQGNYTLFPWLLARLMSWFDPVPLFLWGGLAGLLAFAWASWFCLSSLLPPGKRYWAWLGVLCLPTFYGRTVIFGYAEPFLTPRPCAEALALVAIGLMARKRAFAALSCLALSMLVHPLQALAAALVMWTWAVMQDRRWLHALWLLLPAVGAAMSGLEPFDGLLRRVDADWWAELRRMTDQLFVTGWPALDYQYMTFDVTLLLGAWHWRRDSLGRLSVAAVAGLALGVGGSLLLVDGMHLALPMALQQWRVHWLVHWLAMAVFASRLHADLSTGSRMRGVVFVLMGLLAWGAVAWAWVPVALLYAAWPRILPRLRLRASGLLVGVVGIGIALLLVQHIALELSYFGLAHHDLEEFAIDRRILAYPLLALGLPMAAALLWMRGGTRTRAALFAGLLPLLATAALRWDIQVPQQRLVLQNARQHDLFGLSIPRHAQVYWHDMSLVATWLVLGRADYFDSQQLSGIAFHPGTVREAKKRINRIGPMLDVLDACKAASPDGSYRNCRIPNAALARACAPGVEPRPDILILPLELPFPPEGRWRRTNAAGTSLLADWALYSCDGIARHLQRHAAADTALQAPEGDT